MTKKKTVKKTQPLVLPVGEHIKKPGGRCEIEITIEKWMYDEEVSKENNICFNCTGTGKSSKKLVSWKTRTFDSYQKATTYIDRLNDVGLDGSIRLTGKYKIVERKLVFN